MQDARQYQRITYRLPVDVYCDVREDRPANYTQDISLGGFFAVGVDCMRTDDDVRIELGPRDGDRLHLTGEWTRHPKFGEQLQVSSWVHVMPETLDHVERIVDELDAAAAGSSFFLVDALRTVLPVVLSRFCTVTSSMRVTSSEEVKAVMPMPICAGRLGMALMILVVVNASAMVSIFTPAIMDIITCW